MFQDEKTLNTIHANPDCSVSSGSLKTCDIIPKFLCVIRDTPEYVQLLNVIPCYTHGDNNAEWWSSEDAEAIQSQLIDVLDSYAPSGYYFGIHPGDGADFGFWKTEEE